MKSLLLLLAACFSFSGFQVSEKTALAGMVKNAETGAALVGASITLVQKNVPVKNTMTGADGKFGLELAPGDYDVECRYLGHQTQRITGVNVSENKETRLDFALAPGAVLDEVVVVGYAVKRRSQLDFDMDISRKSSPSVSEKMMMRTAPTDAPAPTGRAFKMEEGAARRTGTSAVVAVPAAAESAPPPPPSPYRGNPYLEDKVGMDEGKPVAKDELGRLRDAPKTRSRPAPKSKMARPAAPETEIALKTISDSEETPEPGPTSDPAPRAGLLTGGEWNDLNNWSKHWLDLLADGEIQAHMDAYKIYPKHRFSVLLQNQNGFPLADAEVRLLAPGGDLVWQSRTDNTGKSELWANLFDPKDPGKNFRLEAVFGGKKHDLGAAKTSGESINRHILPFECQAPKNADIVWAVDATGSMGDEIEYLKTELLDVIGRAKAANPDLALRMGTVFYRDQSDEYITKSSGLSADIERTVGFIQKQSAGGGGDYPEAVHSALEEAVFKQNWSREAVARICFLVLDASPHQRPEVLESLQKSIREAAARGIRIVPLSASGIQKDTEFLMKFFGLATNGTYTFLTDHSGIGGKHLAPTSDEYKIEPLNDLLVRIITECTTVKTCEGKSTIRFEEEQNQQQNGGWQATYFPNPASDQFTLDLPVDVQTVTIYNAEGQAVRKLSGVKSGQTRVPVGDLPEGFYTIRILKDNAWRSGKLMVVRA